MSVIAVGVILQAEITYKRKSRSPFDIRYGSILTLSIHQSSRFAAAAGIIICHQNDIIKVKRATQEQSLTQVFFTYNFIATAASLNFFSKKGYTW